MSQKLQETECTKCGKPITTTRGLITQQWDLTPISRSEAFWVALLHGPVLSITHAAKTWRAGLDRNKIDIPTHRDTATQWLPTHRCWSPPLPGAATPISLRPPAPVAGPDLFNQPAADLPPY